MAEHSHTASAAHEHQHDDNAWAPQDGVQRTLFTGLSNLLVAVGFALMLAGLYTLRAPGNSWQGLLWGLAGFATFNLAAADLLLRQYWWLGTAVATAVGLGQLAFARPWWLRLLGLPLLAIPHLIGAPQPELHESLAPAALGQQFIYASLLSNALFWAALGLASAWLFAREQHAN